MVQSPGRKPRSKAGKRRGTMRAEVRDAARAEFLYGINSARAALGAGRRRLTRLHLKSGPASSKLAALRQLAAERGISVREATPPELEEICGSPNHQGAVLHCGPLPLLDEARALSNPFQAQQPGERAPLLVALDRVEDPRNLGAIVRSAAAFGASGLVLPRDRSAPLSAAASSASAGALETFPVAQAANLARFLAVARKRGYWVAGATASAEAGVTPLDAFDHDGPLVLVLGSEAKGLRPLVARQCDFLLTIPLPGGGGTDSLNVSAAAAVLLYRLRRG